ncbi:MAG: hypothetical protein HYX61_01370 [Gammaproteobacteria bacterium]|jgi:hypothetical protein|nr:hypothetical protein [Gammaproteobacteria bacterium]
MTLSSIELLQQDAQNALRLAQQYLLNAQQNDNPEAVLQGNEGSMLRGDEAQKTVEIFQKVKQKYQAKLREKGGIDTVLKELEKYIIEEKLKDSQFATNPGLKRCKQEDFQLDREGQIKQQNDNLNERGRYKAALRAITEETKIGQGVNFGSVFHHGSTRTLGPSFGRGATPAREVLAYMWLAASDPDIEFSDDAIKELGSKEKAVDAEKESLVNVLSEIQRAHNDGSYSRFDSTKDNPSCDAGAWGRVFISAPLNNPLTKLNRPDENKPMESPGENLAFDVKTKILEQIKALSPQEKMELLNNFNACYVAKTTDPNDVVGYSINNLSSSLENTMNRNFENYWRQLVQNNDTLKEIERRSAGERRNFWGGWGGGPYSDSLALHKQYYKNLWKIEIAKIASGELHQQYFYEPLEKDVLERELKLAREKAYPQLESIVVEERKRLVEVKDRISILRKELADLSRVLKPGEDLKARQTQIERLSKEYQTLQQEKNKLLAIIDNKAKRLAMKAFTGNIELLKIVKTDKEIEQATDALVPKIPDLNDEAQVVVPVQPTVVVSKAEPIQVAPSNLPEEIRNITLEQVKSTPRYADLCKMPGGEAGAQKRIVKNILNQTPKIKQLSAEIDALPEDTEEQQSIKERESDKLLDNLNALAEQWVTHHAIPVVTPVSTPVQSMVDTSTLPEEIGNITLEQVKSTPRYADLCKMPGGEAGAQKRIVKNILNQTPKIKQLSVEIDALPEETEEQQSFKERESDKLLDNLNALAEQWVTHHAAPTTQAISSPVNPPESIVQVSKEPAVPKIEPILPNIMYRRAFEAEYNNAKNIALRSIDDPIRIPEVLSQIPIDPIINNVLSWYGRDPNSQDPETLGMIQWFKNKDQLQLEKLDQSRSKAQYEDREKEFLAAVEEVYSDPGRTANTFADMIELAKQKYPLNIQEEQILTTLAISRLNYLAGMKRAKLGKINESLGYFMAAAKADNIEAKYALATLCDFNIILKSRLSYIDQDYLDTVFAEVKNFEAELAFVERSKKLPIEKAQELSEIERRHGLVAQAPMIDPPIYSEADQYFMEQVEYYYNNFPPDMQKSPESVKDLAFTDFLDRYGRGSSEVNALKTNRELLQAATGKFMYLAGMKRIASASTFDEGVKFLVIAARRGDVNAKNKLREPALLEARVAQEKAALESKYKLLGVDFRAGMDIRGMVTNYCADLENAADLGSEQARLSLIKLGLEMNKSSAFENFDSYALAELKLAATKYFPVSRGSSDSTDFVIIKSLLQLYHDNNDPQIAAQAEQLISDLAEKYYMDYSRSSHNISALTNAAYLEHPLAQLEILKIIASTEPLFNELELYSRVFNSPIPRVDNGEIDFKKLYEQAVKISKDVDPKSKEKAKELISIIKNKYLEKTKIEINAELSRIQLYKSLGKMDVAAESEKRAKEKIAELKDNGVEVSFDLMLADLPGFKAAVGDMPVNPEWLNQMRAELENNEQNIRLATGMIQHELQSQRNEKIQVLAGKLFTHETLQPLSDAIMAHEEIEKAYYELLKQKVIPIKEVQEKIDQLQSAKAIIQGHLKDLQAEVIDKFTEFSLTDKDKEYIRKLTSDPETLSMLAIDQPDLQFSQLLDAAERMHRCDLIKQSHENKTTILEKTREKLETMVEEYKQEIHTARAQVAESVQPGKKSKAEKQYKRLTEAEKQLAKLRNELLTSPENGLQSYQELAQKIQTLSEDLDSDLKKIGSLKKTSQAKNAIKVKINGLLKAVGIEHKLRINTALTSTVSKVLKKKAELAGKLVEAHAAHKEERDIRRRQGVLFQIQHEKERATSHLKYNSEDLKLATEFMNKNLNMGALKIDFNKEGQDPEIGTVIAKEFQAHLQAGVYAEIKQAKMEPITVEFKSIDGSKSMTVEVSKYMFDEYIKQQRQTNEPPSTGSVFQPRNH